MRRDPVPLLLGLAQTLNWAATLYLFPALLVHWERQPGWDRGWLTAVYTGSLLVTAAAAPLVGRVIDAGHVRSLTIAAAACAASALLVQGFTGSFAIFATAWLVIGMAMAALLYEPCFAVLTRHRGAAARPSILAVTLIAGFAGTVAFPGANALAAAFGTGLTAAAFAAAIVLIALPATLAAFRLLEREGVAVEEGPDPSALPQPDGGKGSERRRRFLLLAMAFTAGAVVHQMTVTHILPLLAERGVPATLSVAVAATIGPMQVAGRLVLMGLGPGVTTFAATLVCFGGLALAQAIAFASGSWAAGLFAFAAVQGGAWGLVSIVRPVLTREWLGQARFGATSGTIAAWVTGGTALAPVIGTGLWRLGGYGLMLATGVTVVTAAALVLAATGRSVHRPAAGAAPSP